MSLVGKCLFLLLASTTLSGCEDTKGQTPAASLPQVGVIIARTKPYNITMELPGRTEAFLISDVRPQVSGIVLERKFTEGADVEKQQQLYQIDPASFQASRDSAAATVQRDMALAEQAKVKADRYASLVNSSAISQQNYDDVIATKKTTEADVAVAKAALELAEINLGYTRVAAPIAGRISRSSVTSGALVTSDQTTALATVTQLDPIYIDLNQSAVDLIRIKRAMDDGRLQSDEAHQAKIKLKLEDGSIYPEMGTLQFSEVNVSPATGTVTLRAIVPNPKKLLLPGMYVHAELLAARDDTAIMAPQAAVSRNQRGDATVLIVGDDDIVSLRTINAVRAVGEDWVVTSGLKDGDRIIVDGLQKAKPGQKVIAVPAKES